MKTMEEAADGVMQQDYWIKNKSLMTDVLQEPVVLRIALGLCANRELAEDQRVLQAITIGIAVGIEMEKGK